MFINIQMFLAFSHVLLMQYISPSTSLGGGGVENIARYFRRFALCTYRYRCLRLGSYFSTSPTFRLRYGSMPVNFGRRQEARPILHLGTPLPLFGPAIHPLSPPLFGFAIAHRMCGSL